MFSAEVLEDIERLITSIGNEYRRNQGMILSEHDLSALIFGRLKSYFTPRFNSNRLERLNQVNQRELQWRMHTQDQEVFASPVHLEVPWYDNGDKLTIRPDITILDPKELSILHRYGNYGLRLPSKQFEFAGSAIIMELKFVRHKAGITPPALKSINRDYLKIRDNLIRFHYHPLRERVFCFFVIVNKTDIRCPEFDSYLTDLANGDWYKYIYLSGGVNFNRPTRPE